MVARTRSAKRKANAAMVQTRAAKRRADALHHADSPNDLRLMIKLRSNEQDGVGSLKGVTLDGMEDDF